MITDTGDTRKIGRYSRCIQNLRQNRELKNSGLRSGMQSKEGCERMEDTARCERAFSSAVLP